MKKYFIHEEADYANIGILTNNLHKDFILRHGIKWKEKFEKDDYIGINPTISDVSYETNSIKLSIYKIKESDRIQYEIAEFNFHCDIHNEIAEFIQENYRDITMNEFDESIKKFKDYK